MERLIEKPYSGLSHLLFLHSLDHVANEDTYNENYYVEHNRDEYSPCFTQTSEDTSSEQRDEAENDPKNNPNDQSPLEETPLMFFSTPQEPKGNTDN